VIKSRRQRKVELDVQTQEVVASAGPVHPYLTLSHLPLVQGSPALPSPTALPSPLHVPPSLHPSSGRLRVRGGQSRRDGAYLPLSPGRPPGGEPSLRVLSAGGRQIRSRAGRLYSSTTSRAEEPSLRVLPDPQPSRPSLLVHDLKSGGTLFKGSSDRRRQIRAEPSTSTRPPVSRTLHPRC
jgi:hypothetical protein